MSIGQTLASTSPREGLLGVSPTGDPNDGNAAWSDLTPAQQAAYYASHPTMAAITQLGQGLFGMTSAGQLQNAVVPGFVQDQHMIARGIDPESINVNSAAAQNGSDIGAHPANGFGGPIAAPAQDNSMSITGGLLNFSGGQPPAPVVDVTPSPNNPNVEVGPAIGPGNVQGMDLGLLGGDIGSYAESAGPGAGAPAPGAVDGGYGSYAEVGSGDGGGGGGSKMICTELHRQGLMPDDIFEADQAFGEILVRLHPETYAGYALWARHVVRWMQRGDLAGRTVTKIVHAIATPWAREMAHRMGVPAKRTVAGWLLMEGGLRLCRALGAAAKTNQPRTA